MAIFRQFGNVKVKARGAYVPRAFFLSKMKHDTRMILKILL